MTTSPVTDIARPVPSNWSASTGNAALDAMLDRLERAGAGLPLPLAVPVMRLHDVVARLGYPAGR